MKQTSSMFTTDRGFALVATILLMVLLAVITVGTLSLSVVTLRSGTQDFAKARAQANARMALMIAIGELQRHTGTDTRVTASANIVDKNYPELLGVWKSWEGTDHDSATGQAPGRPIAPLYGTKVVTATPSGTGRFVNWLVSSAATKTAPDIKDAPNLIQTSASTDTIPLLADGSLQESDTRQVHVVPTELDDNGDEVNDGRFAWWVSGENQKARIGQPYKPRSEDVSALVEMGQSHSISDPTVFGLPALMNDPELHNPSNAPAKSGRKAISRQTMDLIGTDNKIEPNKKFHDLSSYSVGLLTNTATGGWRKDLSILTERWDAIYSSYPGGRLPLFRLNPTSDPSSTTQVPKPTKPNNTILIAPTGAGNTAVLAATPNQSTFYPWSRYSDLFIYNNQRQPNYYQAASASWQSLVAFATAYKQFYMNSGTIESPFVWDRVAGNNSTWGGGSTARVLNLYNYNHTQRLHPQIARFQAIVYARAVPRNPPTNPLRYDLRMMWTPVITLWNPYNVGLTMGPLNSAINEELLIGWTRSLPIVLATVLQTAYPGGPSTVPNSAYRFLSPGNFQYLDVNGNFNAEGYDTNLAANTSKGYPTASLMDVRTFGASFPPGPITFKPGETKVFSPRFPGHVHWSGSVRMGEGFNSSNILGFEWTPAGNRIGTDRYWFLMNNDRATRPYRAMNAGLGFALSFGISSGAFYQSHPSHVGVQQQFHNMSTLAPEAEGNTYWPSTDVDEVGYSISELASGPWVPVFSVSLGPRMTIGTGSGTAQNRPTKGVLQSNPLAAMALVNPVSGDPKAHPANGTFDITYHSMSIGSTLTPNLSTSKGFIATGYQSGDGLSRLVMTNIPLRPMASLVELEGWNPRGNNPCPPYQSNLIGNSDASPLIPSNTVIPNTLYPAGAQNNMMHDDAYCANHLLFDDWFVSSIAPQAFGNNVTKDISTAYREYLKGESLLTNRAYRPITADSRLTDAEATTRIAQIISSHDGWLKSASRFEVEGMFNVNTTSVEAWKALLGRAKSLSKVAMHGANEFVSENVSNKHVVTRGPIAPDVEAGSGAGFGGQFANASEYTGFRSLTDEQINDLAAKVVEQVRLRGPFLSLSEFVNRQLSSNEDLALAGAIQTAINRLSVDPMKKLRDPANSLSDNTMAANDPKLAGVNYEFTKAAEGSSAYGAPGWIRQADILRPIAPILSVRDDTFTIRAYGDSLDKNGKVLARAWCEATVKRTREFSDQGDAADSIEPPTIPRNITFGRKYEIVSFRWLNSDEV